MFVPTRVRLAAVVLIALVCGGCAASTPTSPSAAISVAKAGVPASLEFTAGPGVGVTGGTATLTATVTDGLFAPVADVSVTFTAASGTLDNAIVATNARGVAVARLTAPAGAIKVTATTIGLVPRSTVVSVQPAPDTTGPPPSVPPPTTNPAPPTTAPLAVTINAANGLVGDTITIGLSTTALARADWTFGDGATATTTTGVTTHVYTAAAVYPIAVTVTDTLGRTASAQKALTIAVAAPASTALPSYTVTLVASPTAVIVGGSSTLTATVTPQNGAPAATSYAWDCIGDGVTIVTNGTATHSCTYTTTGTTTSRVTATGGSVTGSASATVTTAAPVVSLSCNAGVHQASASSCVLAATVGGVALPSARITLVSWDFGDGILANSVAGNVSPNHIYASANSFTVVGTATISGATGTYTASTTTTILP
jgi:PKD repeat protein